MRASFDVVVVGVFADIDEQGYGTVSEARMYQLIRQSGKIADREFVIEFLSSGVSAYDFTFG